MNAPGTSRAQKIFEDFDNGIGTYLKVVRFKFPSCQIRTDAIRRWHDDLLALVRYCNDLASSHGLVSRCGADPMDGLTPWMDAWRSDTA